MACKSVKKSLKSEVVFSKSGKKAKKELITL